jgi:hypothetical protein
MRTRHITISSIKTRQQSNLITNDSTPSQRTQSPGASFEDNREAAITQRNMKEMIEGGSESTNIQIGDDQAFRSNTNSAPIGKQQVNSALGSLSNDVAQLENVDLKEFLAELGYVEDRNYMSFKGDSKIDHVGWKAHVGAAKNEGLAIAKSLSFLRDMKVGHKFDIRDNHANAISKFLTVYPPADQADWEGVIHGLESKMSSFGGVEVDGDMRVITDSARKDENVDDYGKVYMRHGQNTMLKAKMVEDVVVADGKKWGFDLYKDIDAKVIDFDKPLLGHGGTLFFPQTDEKPARLSPEFVYMAIYFNDKIVPDKRNSPNPAGAEMPEGVNEYGKNLKSGQYWEGFDFN